MRILLLIVFGAIGTLARYGLQGAVQERTGSGFPTGTLAVNLSGCFLLGVIGQYALRHIAFSPDWPPPCMPRNSPRRVAYFAPLSSQYRWLEGEYTEA